MPVKTIKPLMWSKTGLAKFWDRSRTGCFALEVENEWKNYKKKCRNGWKVSKTRKRKISAFDNRINKYNREIDLLRERIIENQKLLKRLTEVDKKTRIRILFRINGLPGPQKTISLMEIFSR